jgi:hypothetical protein
MLKRSVLSLFTTLQIIVLLAAAVKPAHAYVDPGSGLLAFQIGGSMVAGAVFVLRSKLRRLFRRTESSGPESPAANNAGTDSHLHG